MSEYASLAEQVAHDYQTIMSALSGMRDKMSAMQDEMSAMQDDIRRVEVGMDGLNATVLQILKKTEALESRIEALEGLKERVESIERRLPAA